MREGISQVLAARGGHLLISGHSLGAGLATLAAADHASRNPALITFGSARVGDGALCAGVRLGHLIALKVLARDDRTRPTSPSSAA